MLTVQTALNHFDNNKSNLAKFLGISRQAVSLWDQQGEVPSKYRSSLMQVIASPVHIDPLSKPPPQAGAIGKSTKLNNVLYEIRGPILETAYRMEEDGQRILKLNIGNPAAFDLNAPDEIIQDVIHNLKSAEAYSESRGLFSARKAVMQECQLQDFPPVNINDIYMGNGVSELIVLSLQALLNNGDEVLVPSPNYPLWTAATTLCGGTPIHYQCDEQDDWQPDIDDIRKKITPNSKAIVIINPNNPTGAVYNRECLMAIAELARQHNLIIFTDEIYNKVLYDDAVHIPMATIAPDLLVVTFGGLSKNHRLAGFRSGWMIFSGDKLNNAKDYMEGINMLASIRLCANVPGQLAVQTALGGRQSIKDLVKPSGRLAQQRDLIYNKLLEIPGLSCVKPKGALYLFPKLDERYHISNDEKMVLDLLVQQRILIVQGSGFHYPDTQHFRIVFLPRVDVLEDAANGMISFFKSYRQ